MANPLVYTDCVIALGDLDLGETSNTVTIAASNEVQTYMAFGKQGWKGSAPGKNSIAFNAAGFIDLAAGLIDPRLYSLTATPGARPISVATGRTAGDVALFFSGISSKYSPNYSDIGTILEFAAEAVGAGGPLVRGHLLGIDADGGNAGALDTSAVTIAENSRLRAHVHIIGTGTVTPTLEWARDGGGASGTIAGTAVTAPGYYEFNAAWPDAGNDIDVNIAFAATGADYGYVAVAGSSAT